MTLHKTSHLMKLLIICMNTLKTIQSNPVYILVLQFISNVCSFTLFNINNAFNVHYRELLSEY